MIIEYDGDNKEKSFYEIDNRCLPPEIKLYEEWTKKRINDYKLIKELMEIIKSNREEISSLENQIEEMGEDW